ncbi:MAG TPA: hypothetical protein VIX63_10245 [Vicinamibacterales bacterium]
MFDPFFTWLESTAFSVWMRESPSVFAFPIILAVHTIGLGLLAGINAAIDLRLLGIAARIPLLEFRRFLPYMWLGLWLNLASGVALLIAYPTKALTNPLFYIKLALIATALAILRVVRRRALGGSAAPPLSGSGNMKRLALASLTCWAVAIAAGRFLAYTYIRLMVDSVPTPRPWIP